MTTRLGLNGTALLSIGSVTAFAPFRQQASKSTSILSAAVDPTKQVNAPVVKFSLYEESVPMLYGNSIFDCNMLYSIVSLLQCSLCIL